MNEMNDTTRPPQTGQTETARAESGQAVAGPALEGVVIGHATCSRDGCTAPPERVTDPFALEVHGEQVEIDICEAHLAELYDEI